MGRRTGVMGVLVAFFVGVMLTFAGLVCYWRKFDTLPCQKRKEDSARQVLDSNQVKSSS
jgi:predicted RND superfamily exporter protein